MACLRLGEAKLCVQIHTTFLAMVYMHHSAVVVHLSDVDECVLFNASTVCGENAECSNVRGGFNCTCDSGYSGNGLTCSKY